MGQSATASSPGEDPSDGISGARRRFDELHSSGGQPREAELAALEGFVAFAEAHRPDFGEASEEIASDLDWTAAELLKLGYADAADQAVDVGQRLAPEMASLWHRRARVVLARGDDATPALTAVERAIAGQPHEKTFWATKGDVLARMGRTGEAAQAYLSAQRLDPSSSEYLDRAIALVPNDIAVLRMKLELERSHGGDEQALVACDEMLSRQPESGELLLARARLLSGLGRFPEALEATQRAREHGANRIDATLLAGRLQVALGHPPEAISELQQCLEADPPPDVAQLGELAALLAENELDPKLAVRARILLADRDPRNIANLTALRSLATLTAQPDVGIVACRATLDVSPNNLDAMRELAELLYQEGKTDEALATYRALVEAHPHAAEDFRRALEVARAVGGSGSVEAFARAVIAEAPKDVPAHEELARLLEARADWDGALAEVNALLALSPSELRYLVDKKRLLESSGRTEELPLVLDELFRRDPTRADVALERGNLCFERAFDAPEGSEAREGFARAALVSYERASLDPERASASLLGLARASRLLGDPERAVRAYREFLERPGNEKRGDVYKELGHALRELHRLNEADEAYQNAIRLDVEDSDLAWGEVEVLSLLDQDAKALRFIDLLLEREPRNPLFLRRKGQLLLKLGRRSEGLAVLRGAVDGAPGDPHVRFEVAEALRTQGAYADAVTYYRQGLEVAPKDRGGRLALAETLVLAGQASDAVPLIDGLLRDDPNDIVAWQTRADVYRALGRPSEVQYSTKAILLLDPSNGPALAEKYRLHLAANENAEATAALGQLLAAGGPESRDASLWLQHGDLGADLGLADESNRSYERAAQIDPKQQSEVALRRARLRLRAGRPDLALEVVDATPPEERTIATLLLRAEILLALERPAEALAVYQGVHQRDPRSPVAIAGIARCLLDEGQPEEAKSFLTGAMPQGPPNESVVLLLAEAHAGLGKLPDAVQTVEKGVESLPKSAPLWIRLGELRIAQESWSEASQAYAHAIALRPGDATLLERAGFVADRLGHPNEALALYEHATSVAPSDKDAWTHRGIALLTVGRPDEARTCFDRALSLDSDYEPAKEGRKASIQRTRDLQVARYGREALLLEAKLGRTVTKNDLFVTLHVPYELLEPVLTTLTKEVRVDLDRLAPDAFKDLETASYQLVVAALERRPTGIERRGMTLADVAVLSPPTATLEQVQRLFGYVRSVLEADLRPETLSLTPEVEELARRGLLLPESQRTLFQLVRTLRVGLYKARLIKAVESGGAAVHAPLPALDLGSYSPEFRARESEPPKGDADHVFTAENAPALLAPAASEHGHPTQPRSRPAPPASHDPALGRCVGCGGVASVLHVCGAPLCRQCIAGFPTCPKCGQAVDLPESLTPIEPPSSAHSERIQHGGHSAAVSASAASPPPAKVTAGSPHHRPSGHAGGHAANGHTGASASPRGSGPLPAAHPAEPKSTVGKPASEGARPEEPTASNPDQAAEKASEGRPAHPKEKSEDEPRL